MQLDDVKRILQALEAKAVQYVLVGGVAVGLHGLERPTADIDLFVRADDDNISRLRAALRSIWNDPAIDQIQAQDLRDEYPVVRYGPPTGDFFIDIISRVGSEISYPQLEFQEIDLAGVRVRLATPRTLVRMKQQTLRYIDRIDAERLKEKFKLEG